MKRDTNGKFISPRVAELEKELEYFQASYDKQYATLAKVSSQKSCLEEKFNSLNEVALMFKISLAVVLIIDLLIFIINPEYFMVGLRFSTWILALVGLLSSMLLTIYYYNKD